MASEAAPHPRDASRLPGQPDAGGGYPGPMGTKIKVLLGVGLALGAAAVAVAVAQKAVATAVDQGRM